MKDQEELLRLEAMLVYEKAAWKSGQRRVAGVDEAGRGPLAGPVVASACVLPQETLFLGLNDSKKLSRIQRKRLFLELVQHPQCDYGVGVVTVEEIEELNILQAALKAMRLAVGQLAQAPDYLLVDGVIFLRDFSGKAIVEGDQKSLSIAAASVIAKETRDQLMEEYHKQWPCYHFDEHKGYGTSKHLNALRLYGPCPIHRKSFKPIKNLNFEQKTMDDE